MKLLVEQLKCQDPLDPMDNSQMTSQLAQLSSLDQLESMNGTFQQVLATQQRLQAAELIGKTITYAVSGADATTGRVDGVELSDAGIRLKVGDSTVDLADVESIAP